MAEKFMTLNTCKYGVYNSSIDEVEPCGNLVEGNTDMCASHNAFFRKLEKQNLKALQKRADQIAKQKEKNLVPRKMPNKVSPKREELNKEYKILSDEFKREHPQCEIKANVHCTVETTDVHHPAGRIGAELLNVKRWKACCRSCHTYAHDHPLEAMQKGWSQSRLATNQEKQII